MRIAVLAVCLVLAGPARAESPSPDQNKTAKRTVAASTTQKSASGCGEKRCYIPAGDCTGNYKVVNSYGGCADITNGGTGSYWTGDECIGGFGPGD